MTAAKHTPGPWRVHPNANCDVQTADGQFEIATTHPEILRGGECDPTAAHANAALIAAAPDMADAHEENVRILGYLVNELQGRIEGGKLAALVGCLDRSRAAIAKARGE